MSSVSVCVVFKAGIKVVESHFDLRSKVSARVCAHLSAQGFITVSASDPLVKKPTNTYQHLTSVCNGNGNNQHSSPDEMTAGDTGRYLFCFELEGSSITSWQ